MKKHVLLIVCQGMVFFVSYAQVELTLEDCLEYGFKNNLEVKRMDQDLAASSLRLRQSIYGYLPSLEMTFDHVVSSGKSLNFETYSWGNEDIQQGNLAFNSELQLFKGFSRLFNRKMSEQTLSLSSIALECEKMRIGMEIIRSCFRLKLLQVDVEILQNGLADTRHNIGKLQEQIASGAMAKGSLYEMQAQEQKEEINREAMVVALKKEYNRLMQFTGWTETDSLVVIHDSPLSTYVTSFSMPYVDSMVDGILHHSILLSKEQARLDIAKTRVKLQKGYMSPVISLQAGLTTRYLGGAADPENSTGTYRLTSQLSDNRFMQLALTVLVPIYDRNNGRFEVRLAEIERDEIEAEIEIAREAIRLDLLTIKEDLRSLLSKIQRAEAMAKAYEQSYEMAVEKYGAGILDLYSLHLVKNNHTNARLELSKYIMEYAMNLELLLLYDRFSVDQQVP